MPSVTHFTITVIKARPVHVPHHPLTHAVFYDGEVTKHVLVRHLYAEGSLGPDPTHRVSYVHSLYVFQSPQADISRYECSCKRKLRVILKS